jgi:hypothetical protein
MKRPTLRGGRAAGGDWSLVALTLIVALAIGGLPLVLAACCAPPGATGLGTVWFINDFAQYESAMRQGATQSSWLIYDAFTAEPHPPTFMFPLYVAVGKFAALLQIPPSTVERVLEVVARALLVFALWRFCRVFAACPAAARWAFGLALFASGFEIVAAVVGGYTGNWSYETNGFGLLFAAPHVPLAMAATLELARGLLAPVRPARTLATMAVLGAAVAILHPFHVPVLLAAALVVGVIRWRGSGDRVGLAVAVAACAGALPPLVPTLLTFSFDPFWAATYGQQNILPSPAPHELLVDFGAVLLLAIGGAFTYRARVAPFGLLLWVLFALMAMYLPVPYQRRLSFGLQPALAVLAANTVVAWAVRLQSSRAAVLRLGVVAAAGSGTMLVLVSVVASGLRNAPLRVYRSTADLDRAGAWLNAQVQPSELILADWDTSNYLAARTPARVVGGHPVATLRPGQKQLAIDTVFAHADSLAVARSLHADWVVFGPDQTETHQEPAHGAAFRSGSVRVYRLNAE